MEQKATISRDQFIRDYCERSGMTWEELQSYDQDAFPCNCGEDECEGWQMVSSSIHKMYEELRK